MMLFLCYPNCNTCKKARKWLEDRGIAFEARDIKTDKPTSDELLRWQEKSGLPLRRFWNTSGLQYKALNLKERLPEMGAGEQLDLLSSDGMLVKRPLLIGEDFVLVGFKSEEWEDRLGMTLPEARQ
jgi:arsenate reductase